MAGDFLNILSQTIIPTSEKALNADVKTRVVAGYSMGGLFAIYTCLQTNLFDRAASMSGSLWYDGFADYVTEQTIPANLSHVFFSLGKRERLTKNVRMAETEKCTIRIREYFECAGVHTKYEVSEGGHFDHVPQRIAHGIEEILEL